MFVLALIFRMGDIVSSLPIGSAHKRWSPTRSILGFAGAFRF